eukprot:GEMP01027490.1.p1 GENE.GEMP01027490.1~~GEMP01027490.1.p1  ORF type:complete len:333 (+),score=59.86 GEMP01027490.1:59-1000(+)
MAPLDFAINKALQHPAFAVWSAQQILSPRQRFLWEPLMRRVIMPKYAGGETFDEARAIAAQLRQRNIGTIYDSPDYRELMHKMAEMPHNGPRYMTMKITPDELPALCEQAHRHNVRVFVDAEEYPERDALHSVTREMMIKYNKHEPIVNTTIQMYYKDSLDIIKRDLQEIPLYGLKLVRGAYHQREIARGSPVFTNKEDTDNAYNEAVGLILEKVAQHRAHLLIASHNRESFDVARQHIKRLNITEKIPVAQIRGIADLLTQDLKADFDVMQILYFGSYDLLFPWLVRRLEENAGWLSRIAREENCRMMSKIR